MREAGAVFFDCGVDALVAFLDGVVVLEDELTEAGSEGGERGGVDIMCCDAGIVCLHALQLRARESDIPSHLSF